jgi:hypothetical protein
MECACYFGYGPIDMAVQIRRDIAIPIDVDSHEVIIRVAAASIHPCKSFSLFLHV